jgi:hypothetical protein
LTAAASLRSAAAAVVFGNGAKRRAHKQAVGEDSRLAPVAALQEVFDVGLSLSGTSAITVLDAH